MIAIKAGPGRFQHVKKNLKMNPFSQTRILLMYLILISEGWTWGRPLPSPNPLSLSSPSRIGERIARGNFPSFPPSLFSLIFLPSSLPSLSSPPPTPHPLSPLPFILSAPSLTASVILNVGLQLEMRVPASEQ